MSRSIPALAAALICGGPLSHFAQGQDSGPSSTVPAFPAESSITVFQVTPAAGADNTQSAPWAAKVRLWFLNPHAQVTTWGPLVKEGNTFSINFEAIQPSGDSGSGEPAGGIIAPGVTHERTYTLGILAPGPYKINLTSRGRLIREKSFTVGPPPPGDEVRAHVTLTVDPSDPNAVKARAHVEFEGYFIVAEQLPVRRDAIGRFILEARVEPAAVIAIFPPPPFPVVDLDYALGAVPAGNHVAVFRMNGRTFAERPFTVGNGLPDVPAHVTAQIASGPDGTRAHVRIELPNPYFEMTDPGQPVRDGSTISINATLVPINTLVPIPAPKIIEQDYALGVLADGDYRLVYKINGRVKLEMPFHVGSPPPPPDARLVDVSVQNRNGTWVGLIDLLLMPDVGVRPPEVEREGNHFYVDVQLVQLGLPIFEDDVPRPVRIEAPLGQLAQGLYVFSATLGEVTKREEFVVRDGPPPPPDVRLAFIEIQRTNTGGHAAHVGVLLPPGKTVSDWGVPARDGNKFTVSLTIGDAPPPLEPTPLVNGPDSPAGDVVFNFDGPLVIGADGSVLPVPINLQRHTYNLGTLDPGEYVFVVQVGDRVLGQRAFRVVDDDPPPPPPPGIANIEVRRDADGAWNALVRVVLSNPRQAVLDWGEVVKDGNHFKATITIGEAPPDPAAADAAGLDSLIRPRLVFEHVYKLGALEPGEYSFALFAGEQQIGLRFFRVIADPPPPPPPVPRLAFIEIHEGDASTMAEVGLLLPANYSVKDWGEVMVDGATFKVAVKFEVADVTPAVILPPRLERHTYSLGVLDPGEYKFVLCDAADNRVLGARMFRVGPKPPPPPPPKPFVAFIEPGRSNDGWFVEVGLVFPRPGLEVKDWGTPVRTENKFKVNIEIGEADPPPVDPTTGARPVFLGAGTSAGEPPSIVLPEVLDDFNEIGGWPVRLVRHRYPLGALEEGIYLFAVCLDGEPAAQKEFRVPSSDIPGPTMTVQAEPITTKSSAPQSFRILYTAAAGWRTEPGEGPVTVKGPHGFEAKATLKECVQSLDPIGRLWSCRYEIAGPGGDWDAGDNGEYIVCVDPAFVVDRLGRTLERPCAFGWRVRIIADPPPHLPAELVVSMRDGKWFADVKVTNTGNWWMPEWGDVHSHGPVFFAKLSLSRVPPNIDPPIMESFAHTYELGELRPGHYLFVFKSNVGHCASRRFIVPGVEPPTPLEQWILNALGAVVSGDADDSDGDGLPLFGEFYLGCRPDRPDTPDVRPAIVLGADGQWHLALNFRRVNAGDGSVRCIVEVSSDMTSWSDAGTAVDLIPGAPDIDGSQLVCACQRAPLRQARWPFMRLRLEHAAP